MTKKGKPHSKPEHSAMFQPQFRSSVMSDPLAIYRSLITELTTAPAEQSLILFVVIWRRLLKPDSSIDLAKFQRATYRRQ